MSCPADEKWKNRLLDFLWEYHLKRLSQIAGELGLRSAEAESGAKNYGAWVAEALVTAAGREYAPRQMAGRGVALKTVRMPESGRPYESMSFPAFDHSHLAAEEWETSSLKRHLACLLVITLYGRDRTVPLSDCVLGHAFFWHPDEQQGAVIREEWTRVRDLVRKGRMGEIPTEAHTRAIHVRPHGRDSYDVVLDMSGHEVVRSSLWLNRDFVMEIVLANR